MENKTPPAGAEDKQGEIEVNDNRKTLVSIMEKILDPPPPKPEDAAKEYAPGPDFKVENPFDVIKKMEYVIASYKRDASLAGAKWQASVHTGASEADFTGKVIDIIGYTQSNRKRITIECIGQENYIGNHVRMGDEVSVRLDKYAKSQPVHTGARWVKVLKEIDDYLSQVTYVTGKPEYYNQICGSSIFHKQIKELLSESLHTEGDQVNEN